MTELPPHIPDTASYKAPPVLLPYQQRWVADGAFPQTNVYLSNPPHIISVL